jgi:NADH-quinone oxidoreductase subunit C
VSAASPLVALVQAALGGTAAGGGAAVTEFRDEVTLHVPAARVLDVLRLLRDAPGGTPMLTDLTAVDRAPAEPRFEVVYQLTGFAPPVRVRVKAALAGAAPDGGAPAIASATALWAAADWLEREVFDLFGIRFDGHPNLVRILLPDDWEGHPLRKDFPLTEEPVEFHDHTPKAPSQIIPRTAPRP